MTVVDYERAGLYDPAAPGEIALRPLFDDPDLVDAEPIAVYSRKVNVPPLSPPDPAADRSLTLPGGRAYTGPVALAMSLFEPFWFRSTPSVTFTGRADR